MFEFFVWLLLKTVPILIGPEMCTGGGGRGSGWEEGGGGERGRGCFYI